MPTPSTTSSRSSPGRCSAASTGWTTTGRRATSHRRAGSSSRPTTSRTSTRGRSAMPLWPRRQLYFMAKVELFKPPLAQVLSAGGAFPVRRGERDLEAFEKRGRDLPPRATSSRCSRRGRDDRRGCASASSRGRARARRGSRSRRACRSSPPRSRAPTGSRAWRSCGSPTATRSRSTTSSPIRGAQAYQEATERLMERIYELYDACDAGQAAARRRRRLARPPRLPRAAQVDAQRDRPPLRRDRRLRQLPAAPVAVGGAARGARRLGLRRRAHLSQRGVPRLPVRAASSTPSCSSSSTSCRSSSVRWASRPRSSPGTRRTTSSPPRSPRRSSEAATLSSPPPTATRSSSSAS